MKVKRKQFSAKWREKETEISLLSNRLHSPNDALQSPTVAIPKENIHPYNNLDGNGC